jgi:HNH endonuclease
MSTADELCPYCRRPFADGGGPTDDHVIGDAFGTKAKIPACKHCNDTFGDTIEGELHREDSIFRLALAFASMKPLVGTSEGRDVVTDFAEEEVSPRAPDVSVTHDGAKLELHVSGSEPQVRRVLEQFETSQGVTLGIDELVAKGQAVSTPYPTIDVELNWDDKVARRFVGKAGLAAGVYIFGPEFADSDLAAQLRGLRNGESVSYEVANPDRLIEAVSGIATNFGVAPLTLPRGPGAASQVTFVPIPGDVAKTAISVDVLGFPVHSAVVVEGSLPMPSGAALAAFLPVALIEDGGPPVVRDLNQELVDVTT